MTFDETDPNSEIDPGGIEFPSTSTLDLLSSSFANQRDTGAAGSMSKAFVHLEIWTPIIEKLNQYAGPLGRGFVSKIFFGNDNKFTNPAIITADSFNGMSELKYREYTEEIYQYIQDNQDSLPEDLKGINAVLIDSLIKQSFDNSLNEESELAKNNPGFVAGAVRFAAGMGASFGDPVTQATIPFGGWSKSLWKNVGQNMIINGGTGALSEIAVAEWYKEMNTTYTYADFVRNVSLNAALGGVIPLGGRGIKMTWQQAKKAVNAFTESGQKLNSGDQAVVDALEDLENLEETNPFVEVTAMEEFDAGEAHAETLSLAQGAAVTNTQPPIPYEPILPLKTEAVETVPFRADDGFNELRIEAEKDVGPYVVRNPITDKEKAIRKNMGDAAADAYIAAAEARGQLNTANRLKLENAAPVVLDAETGTGVKEFDPSEIEVDARTFQFKSDGDEFGVSERLQGITTWDKYKAGTVTVYEYADGRVSIADGHQRLGLAKRIAAEDPTQKIKILGFTMRQVDGISPEQARAIAAMKNIAEGTGTAIDAAKVLRTYPERLGELPPRSELVRQARDMMPLSDNAFGAIVNGVISAKYGAIVGRLIDDEKLQDAAIQVLAKSDPSNAFQAEAIVRQVRSAGAEDVKQVSLFGDELVSESFYVERANILDRAYKELRQDKNAFETLVRNSERLEAEGNVLATEANQRKATTDAQTIAILQTLANRKGPLSDALTEASRAARETGNYVPATRGFLDAVRRSIDGGDFDGISASDIGRTVDGPAPRPRSEIAEEPALEGFDEPSGVAAKRQSDQLEQDLFENEAVAPVAAVISPYDIEADLKARQPVETVDDIYALADESQTYIATIAEDIERDLGVTFKNPGLKNIDDARKKMERKGYVSSNQMTDISRGGFIVNTAEDADAIVARFGRDAEILDEGWNFTPAGYFDRKILVRTPNGIVSEIQIWSPKVLAAKQKTGHKLYTKMRESKDPAEIESLSIQMRELYANALRSEDQSFRSLSGIDNLPKVDSNADINAASSGITRPVSKTSGPSTGVQSPPGSSIATASVGEVEIAGRPSQLTNIIDDTSDSSLDITSADVNLDLEVPVGTRVNIDTGEVTVRTSTLRDLKLEMAKEQAVIDRLEFCTV